MSLCEDWVTTIIVEANKTHTGWDKPLYFEQHKDEFKRFNIMYLVVDDMPLNATAREREKHQRNKITEAVRFFEPKPDDFVIISDVDEIPRAKQVNKFKPDMVFSALLMNKYAYHLNCLESEQSWDRARIMTAKALHSATPEDLRNCGYDLTIHQAGWHFSWCEDPLRKLQSFSHTELDNAENIERLNNRENFWNDDKLKMVDIDLSYPEYLVKNIDKFKRLIK